MIEGLNLKFREVRRKKLVSKVIETRSTKLRVVSLTNLEDVKFGRESKSMFRQPIVTGTGFELPEYKNISVQLPSTDVKPEDVDLALERLRDQSADFVDVPERGVEMEDFVVLDFEEDQ